MARQIIKQPNGTYSEYSSIVEAFVFVNATASELIRNARQEAADAAEEKCTAALKMADSGAKGQFGVSFDEALKNHNLHCMPEEKLRQNSEGSLEYETL